MSISVVISTYNRKKFLQECLESVKEIADEIIVVDNTSSDDSVTVAKKYTKHVFVRSNNPMLNINKNFGISKASKDWILYLDDDEKLTPELSDEIASIINHKSSIINGYYIPRKNIIFGKWIQHTGWYPDHQLRLFKKGKGKYPAKHVHEMLKVEGEIGYLKSAMEHQNYTSIQSFVTKTALLYAPNEADVLLQDGYVFSPVDVIAMPAKEFLSRFFAREGYKDGLHGLFLSLLMAFYHLLVFGYLWEKKNFTEVSQEELASLISKDGQSLKKEFSHWEHELRMNSEKNSVKRFLLRLKRKVQ